MKLSTRTIYGLAIAAVFAIALFIRIYFPYHNVFASGWVNFHENDPWYHMRIVENLVHHFPHLSLFDPYGLYPGGRVVTGAPLFDLLLGFFVWVIGLGSPSKHVIETVGAYFPAILGALVTIPVYFMGKELFNRKAGLIAAALAAILPGQYLWRSLLGFADHHIAEVLFSALTMMFLMLAFKSSRQNALSFNSLKNRAWGNLKKPLIYSLLAGIALGCYLLSWEGGALFVFIIFAFAVVQYIIDHLRGRSTDYLWIVGVPALLIALFIILPSIGQYSLVDLQIASLLIAILAFLVMGVLSFLMVNKNVNRFYYPLALIVLGGIGLAIFYAVDPSLLDSILSKLSVFTPKGGYLTVAEMKGLSLSAAWQMFSTCFYLSLISLAIIVYSLIKEGVSEKTLLFIWSLIMLIAVLGQNRFAYYFAVNVALLTSYLCWRILQFAGFKETSVDTDKENKVGIERLEREKVKAKPIKKAKRRKGKDRKSEQRVLVTKLGNAKYAYSVIAILVVFFLAFYPNIGAAIDRAKAPTGAADDWHESLAWMKDNTPDPFQNPAFYYELYQKPATGQVYNYPESAYGVMSWWDYGRWISYIAQRIPNASPGGQANARDAGLFFTAQDEASASEVLDKFGSRYVIIDRAMATSKFYAMAIWADKAQSQFFDVFYQSTQANTLEPVVLYFTDYYQSMCSRLYIYAGEKWIPQQISAISWTVRQLTSTDGNKFSAKVISDKKSFSTYDDAEAFVEAHTGYKIVGDSPYDSPVPLEELEHYKLVHKSPSLLQGGTVSYVEIFEYSP